MEENYSIQAKNLLDNLINEYNETIKSIHKIDIVLKQVKGIRIEVNKRTRWISEVANISKEVANRKVRILIYNEDYIDPVKGELKNLSLECLKSGQFIDVIQPEFSYNDLMSLVDEIEAKQRKILTKCSKAKMDPVLRSKNAVENEFIDQAIARKTSSNCQEIFDNNEKKITELTNQKIKMILGNENYKRFVKENF